MMISLCITMSFSYIESAGIRRYGSVLAGFKAPSGVEGDAQPPRPARAAELLPQRGDAAGEAQGDRAVEPSSSNAPKSRRFRAFSRRFGSFSARKTVRGAADVDAQLQGVGAGHPQHLTSTCQPINASNPLRIHMIHTYSLYRVIHIYIYV